MVEIECVVDCKNVLGEGPVWCPDEKALYWVDIKGKSINRFTPASGKVETWPVEEEVGSIALRTNGDGMIVAFYGGFRHFDPATGVGETIHEIEPETPTSRLNDGRCDRQGRFWAGSMDDEMVAPLGGLYRLDADLSVHKAESNIICSNSIAFSPDGATLYYADLGIDTIWAYDLDTATGNISNRRVFASTKDMQGKPDGSAVDSEGYLWNAMWDGWCLARWAPDGTLDRTVEVPVQRPTCPMFGGDNLDVIYLTCASWLLSEEDLVKQPQAGGVFAITGTGATGLPEPRFAG
jgi:L-arabinonolactonase